MIAYIFSITVLFFVVSAIGLATTTAADIRRANTEKRLQSLRSGGQPVSAIESEGIETIAATDPYIHIIPRQWRPNFKRILENAGDAVSMRTLVLVVLVSTPATYYFFSYFFSASFIINAIVAIGGGIFSAFQVISWAQGRTKAKFLATFPDGIDLIVRAVRAGLPITAALDAVAKETPDPVGRHFQLLVADMKIGMTFEESMRRAGDRVDLLEFSFFTASLILQRETGGNLSETLETLGTVLRRRQEMVLKIRTLTSEARASAYIMAALPFFISGALMFLSPSYLTVYFVDPRAHWILGAALLSLFIGMSVMRVMLVQASR